MRAGPRATPREVLVGKWEGLVTPWEQEGECDNMSGLSTEEVLQCTSLDVHGSSFLAVELG